MTDTPFQRILAVETATPRQALALVEGDEVREHRVQRVRYNHGSSLLRNIDQLLSAREIDPADIDLFAAGLGPGSFTGLRVGLATVKALSRATQTPIAGVSSLAALAMGPARIRPDATILAAFDARRREVYAGAYRWVEGRLLSIIEDCAITPDEWIRRVDAEVEGPTVIVGDGQSKYPVFHEWDRPDLTVVSPALAPPSALGVAQLARARAIDNGPDDRIDLEPNYIRPSDAVLPDRAPGPMPPAPEESS